MSFVVKNDVFGVVIKEDFVINHVLMHGNMQKVLEKLVSTRINHGMNMF